MAQPPAIQLNQVGYHPGYPKLAVVTGKSDAVSFYLLRHGSNDTVFTGILGTPRQSAFSHLTTRHADFSAFKKEGQYNLHVPGYESSPVFTIGKKVYAPVAKSLIKAFYFFRSDAALLPQYAGQWSRGPGHPDTAVLIHPAAAEPHRPAGTQLASPGGWYDAGDYNKYIVNSGITMGSFFAAFEDAPKYFKSLSLHIPQSSNKVPDVLDEALYNLRWMLTMQDPADGGVYHKCTNAAFDGMVMPGVTKAPRYLAPKSTAAALDFAAVTAQAARIFKNYKKQLPGLADSCLRASEQAWNWAVSHPDVRYSQKLINASFDPDITTGEYGNASVEDEWLWAAAELYITTGNSLYLEPMERRKKNRVFLPSWGNVGTMAYLSMARHEGKIPAGGRALAASMKDSILAMADRLVSGQHAAWSTVMGQSRRDFEWGSNAVAANQGMVLLSAYRIKSNKAYLNGALSNLDYLLGRNATGYCFVTGFGTRSPMHPHHRPSEADGIAAPIPGMLVGGPNPGMQDGCAYPFKEPETAFVDHVCSYASNEIAINWNAAALYLVNMINALKKR